MSKLPPQFEPQVGNLELTVVYSVKIPEPEAATLDFSNLNGIQTKASLQTKFVEAMEQAGYTVYEIVTVGLLSYSDSENTLVQLEIYCFLDGVPEIREDTALPNIELNCGTLSFTMKPSEIYPYVLTEDDLYVN